jgi:hypothetical protein
MPSEKAATGRYFCKQSYLYNQTLHAGALQNFTAIISGTSAFI